ncbi:MAG: efflux RND transporter permease subunit [Candidatus Eisenbacteria sp.]|nr:efflux RND transporter permease subunit [Candidatus Eisenbacteria bacterium]
MKLTNVAINRAMTVFALMIMVVIMGYTYYRGLPREASPDIKIPFVLVMAPYFGTSPEDIENLVTRKLEQQLKGVADLKEMSSVSAEGYAQILLEFTSRVEMSDALQKVRDAVEAAKPDLPQDVRDDLAIVEISSDDWPIMSIVLSGDYDLVALKQVGEDIQEELERIDGVLEITLTGGVEREVRVDVDPQRLRFYNLGLIDVMDAIRLENITIPGGDLALGTYDYQVRVPGEFESVDEIPGILINPGAPTPVYVRDVAEVSLGIKDRETISRLNGTEAVTLSIKKRSGENAIRIAEEVHAAIERLKPTIPEGIQVTVTNDVSVFIQDMVNELENNILSGLLLVIIVLFLFFGLRNALFVGAAIPFSMLISFIILAAMGITLNIVVLFSLILSLGMLVDNAIVIVENIFRYRVRGEGADEAARNATHQVSAAVIASTLTTVCAFAPMIAWPGIMGEFMKYLPITVIVTLVSSLLVAIVFNPVLCARFMHVPKGAGTTKRLGDRLIAIGLRTYTPTIRWTLCHRALTLGGMFLLLVIILVAFARFNAGVELFPDSEPTFAYVNLEAPSGTRVEVTDVFAKQVEEEIAKLPDLKAYVSDVGTGGGNVFTAGGAAGHLATVSMEFFKKEERTTNTQESLKKLRAELSDFTGGRLTIDKEEEGPPTGAPVTIEISGDDFALLGDVADEVQDRIRDIPGLVDLQDDYDRGRPEIQIRPSLEKAGRLGLRTMDLASMIRTAIHGDDVSEYRSGEDEYDIVVRLAEPARRSIEDIEDLTVFHEGQHIPITAFAEVSYDAGLASINRIDSRRVVTVTAEAAEGYNSAALLGQVQERLADISLPAGYRVDYTGENEDMEEAIEFLSDAFAIAVMAMFLVLITQFTSLTIPFVIISSVILSLIGVLTGLMVTRTPFGVIMTGVGVISLAGIVVNNAIVLLDYVIKLRARGMEKMEAIIEAGRTRFRPVILTAITTILGLIPLTTGFSINFGSLFSGNFSRAFTIGGDSSAWWGPMGTAVIWGLSVATFLTLVVVPVMYSSLDPIKRWGHYLLLELPLRPFRRLRPEHASRSEGT